MFRISKNQLFTSIMLLEIGSTTLFALGIGAKQDAWLVILIALIPGFFLLWIYTRLQKNYPEKNFAEIIIELLENKLGIPLIILYSQYFIYLSVQVFTEFRELISITALPKTSTKLILFTLMLLVIYSTCLGVEVIFRISEILFPFVLCSIIILYVLIIINGLLDFNNIRPILGNGITSDMLFEIFHVMTFPYGDILTFLMYWCYVNSKKVVVKTSFWAIGLSGVLLSFSLIVIICTSGSKLASMETIPLLESTRMVKIGTILTNLDVFAIIAFFIGGFFKGTIYFYAGVLAISSVIKKINIRWIIVLSALFIFVYGTILIKSFVFHRWLGIEVITKYMHAPFQLVIPLLLLFINWLKKFKVNCERGD